MPLLRNLFYFCLAAEVFGNSGVNVDPAHSGVSIELAEFSSETCLKRLGAFRAGLESTFLKHTIEIRIFCGVSACLFFCDV